MALPIREQAKYWGITLAVIFALLWVLGDVILPFLVGGALAYFLDPVADRLERGGMGRVTATSFITLAALLIVVGLVLAVIPALVNQLTALVNAAPEIAQRLQAFLIDRFPELQDSTSTVRQSLAQIAQTIQSKGAVLVEGIFSSLAGAVSVVVFLLVVPVVAFYLLMDWDHMVARIDGLLPRDHAPTIRRLAGEINTVLSAFVRGQLSVCLVFGIYYSVALMLVGLQFGLVVGAIAGAITFIPYIGAIVGGILAIGLAVFQFWGSVETEVAGAIVTAPDWLRIGIVAAIFGAGQFLEGNVLTPKLVGKSVGLHPVWLLFALSAFGTLFGFVGMLIAVPVAASLGVLTRFGLSQYHDSLLYQGIAGRIPEDEDQA